MGTRDNEHRSCREHSVRLDARSNITLIGIDEVISYDEASVVMDSSMGQITIDGEGLNIVKLNLDEGEVCINGKLNALYYMEQRKGTGLLSRLFS